MKRCFGFVFTLLVLLSASLLAIPPRYQLVDLGLLLYTSSEVLSINENGVVCGCLMDGSTSRIFVVDSNNKKLALRNSDFFSCRLKVNNHNEIFGSIAHYDPLFEYFSEEVIFKWINPFDFKQYVNFKHVSYHKGQRTPPYNFRDRVFWDANDLGQILVMNTRSFSDVMSWTTINKIWLYAEELIQNIEDPQFEAGFKLNNRDKHGFQKIEHPQFEAGFKLNNRGEILGCYHTGSALNKNRQSHVSVFNYPAQSVRTLEFPGNSVGLDINDQGQVVGNFYHPQERKIVGFLAAPTGEYTPLANFWPFRMNNMGQIVGSYLHGLKKDKPAIWDNGEIYDLADLVKLKDDIGNVWESLDLLTGINDRGEIIGNGTVDGKSHGFLLRPLK